MASRVCEIHEEFCPTGLCRWCEPLDPPLGLHTAFIGVYQKLAFSMAERAKAYADQPLPKAWTRPVAKALAAPYFCRHQIGLTEPVGDKCRLCAAQPLPWAKP